MKPILLDVCCGAGGIAEGNNTVELVLTDMEFYDLFKSLKNMIDLYPEVLGNRKDLLASLTMFYKTSPDPEEMDQDVQFVITTRLVDKPVADVKAETLLEDFRIEIQQTTLGTASLSSADANEG